MTNKFLLTLSLCLSGLVAEAQCDLSRKPGSISYNPERAYRNENLEDGLFELYIGTVKDDAGWHIIGTIGTTSPHDADVKPNTIIIKFENISEPLTLKTKQISTNQDERLNVVFSVFDINASQLELLKKNRIQNLFYLDYPNSDGAGKQITNMRPNLIMNQIGCISSAI